jgi:hypothetical protein
MSRLSEFFLASLIGTGAGFAWWCFMQMLLPTFPVAVPVIAGIVAANVTLFLDPQPKS